MNTLKIEIFVDTKHGKDVYFSVFDGTVPTYFDCRILLSDLTQSEVNLPQILSKIWISTNEDEYVDENVFTAVVTIENNHGGINDIEALLKRSFHCN